MMTTIRQSTLEDIPALALIWRSAVLATHDFLLPADFEAISTLVVESYLPHAKFWVAVDIYDNPIGFMGLKDNHIDSLFIMPQHHGQGIGKKLVAHAAQIAGALLSVDVNEQNVSAVGFYKRLGFQVTGRSSCDSDGRPYPLLHMKQI